MSYIEIELKPMVSNCADTNTFTSKPITMVNFVYVTIERPLMKEGVNDFAFAEDAYSTSNDTTVKIVAVRQGIGQFASNKLVVIFNPDFLQEHKIIISRN